MIAFTAAVDVAAPGPAVWDRLTDWPAHSRWIPLTRVRTLTTSGEGVGARFVGRTGLGPMAFDDPMEVTSWQPPTGSRAGHCSVRKLGRVVRGSARFDVAPAPGGCRVTWWEEVGLPLPTPGPVGRLVAVLGRMAFTRTLQAMAREAERAARSPADG